MIWSAEIPATDRAGKSAEEPTRQRNLRSQAHAATHAPPRKEARRRFPRKTRGESRCAATLFRAGRLHLRSCLLAGGGRPPLSESMPAESPFPAPAISATRPPNAHEQGRIPPCGSRPGPPRARRISSRETCFQTKTTAPSSPMRARTRPCARRHRGRSPGTRIRRAQDRPIQREN